MLGTVAIVSQAGDCDTHLAGIYKYAKGDRFHVFLNEKDIDERNKYASFGFTNTEYKENEHELWIRDPSASNDGSSEIEQNSESKPSMLTQRWKCVV